MPRKVPAQVSASVIIPAPWPITWEDIRSTRRAISAAARRENVRSKMRRGSAPSTIKCATLCASVLVFPDPAPAITSKGRAAVPPLNAVLDGPPLFGVEFGEIGSGHVESPPLDRKPRSLFPVLFAIVSAGLQGWACNDCQMAVYRLPTDRRFPWASRHD